MDQPDYTIRSGYDTLDDVLNIGRGVGYLAKSLGLKPGRSEILFGGTGLRQEQLRLFVAVDPTNYILGCAVVAVLEQNWHLIALWVNPARRRLGIGTALMTAICQAGDSEGTEIITLQAELSYSWHAKLLGTFRFRGLSGKELEKAIIQIRESFPEFGHSAETSSFMCRQIDRDAAQRVYSVREPKRREIGLLEIIRRQLSPPDIAARFMNPKAPGSPFSSFDQELSAHRLWVVADSEGNPVGFAVVDAADGDALIREFMIKRFDDEFVSGSNLATAICSWAFKSGYGGVTVSAFRSLSSSLQIFRELGFSELFELNFGPRLMEISEAERSAGIPAHARIFMSLSFTSVRF